MSDARKILMSMMLLGSMVRDGYFEQEPEDVENESESEEGDEHDVGTGNRTCRTGI